MNTEELRTFVVLAACPSFTQAARDLGLSQPAVSRHVQRLEAEFGAQLIERRRGPVTLTRSGHLFRAFAEEVLEGRRRLIEVCGEGPAPLKGDLRIAASSTPGEFLVPRLVAEFKAVNPAVVPEVTMTDSRGVLEHLRDRRCDIGFTGVKPADPTIHYQELMADEVVLAVPAGHRFAGRTEIDLDELAREPFIDREPGSGTRQVFLEAVAQAGRVVPGGPAAMALGSTRAVLSAVRSGYGVGLVSALALQEQASGGPVPVRFSALPLRRSLYVVLERARNLGDVPAAFATWVLLEARPA